MRSSHVFSPVPLHAAAPRDQVKLPHTLAFWALWHCRHARPPDDWTAQP
ncbi:MAG: hypothetical protein ACLGID_11915 [Gammaproteobacteria bacterium]|nr:MULTISPECIES: hypothetical protein [unclassified Pseudomonas]